jgi:hypothetical protein
VTVLPTRLLIAAYSLFILSMVLFGLVIEMMGPFGMHSSPSAVWVARGCISCFLLSFSLALFLVTSSLRKRQSCGWASALLVAEGAVILYATLARLVL